MEKLAYIGLAIVLIFISVVLYYITHKEGYKTIKGILTEQNLVIINGISYELDISNYTNDKVYIKYYDSLKEMVVIGFLPDIGYVLSPTDRDICKFYQLGEIYIATIGSNIEGYIKDDKFYAISTSD